MQSGPSEGGPGERCRAVVLVGFMAAGKSSVGARLAERLGWRLVDIDDELVVREGQTIPEIFRERGEAWFRTREAALVREFLDLSDVVVVPGGGWASASRGLEDLPGDVLSVWLKVGPAVAVARARRDGPGRPLLDGADDLEDAARRLLSAREPDYRAAALHLDTEGRSPLELADAIIEHLA